MNQFLIPANTKKSKLILGFFTLIDLIVFDVRHFADQNKNLLTVKDLKIDVQIRQ